MEHTHTSSVSGLLVTLMAELNQQVGAHRVVAEVQVGEESSKKEDA